MGTVSDTPAKFGAAGHSWKAKHLKHFLITKAKLRQSRRTLTQPKSSPVATKRPFFDLFPQMTCEKMQCNSRVAAIVPVNGVDVGSIRPCSKQSQPSAGSSNRQHALRAFGPYSFDGPPENGGKRCPTGARNISRFPVLFARGHDPVQQLLGLACALQQCPLPETTPG